MLRRTLAVFLLAFALAFAPATAIGKGKPSPVSAAIESTVFISGTLTHMNYNGTLDAVNEAYCSGFVIYSKGTVEKIATARHCTLDDAEDAVGVTPQTVTFFDGDRAFIKHITRSDKSDVAVLTVHSMRHHLSFKLGSPPNIGDPLYVFGMPNGVTWTWNVAEARNGSSTITADIVPGPEMLVECAGCGPGDSGAPLINANGEVIGVFNLGMGQAALGAAVPVSELRGLQ